MLRLDNNNDRLTVFFLESIPENTFDSLCRIPMMPEPAREAITQIEFFNLANQFRPNATEADKFARFFLIQSPWPDSMRGVTLKAPINELSGSFFVANSTNGKLHDFRITEHCGEHRNVLMGELSYNQPLCFKQWH